MKCCKNLSFYQWPLCGPCVASVWPLCGPCVAPVVRIEDVALVVLKGTGPTHASSTHLVLSYKTARVCSRLSLADQVTGRESVGYTVDGRRESYIPR